MPERLKILVTGATGFVGSNLVRQLVAQGATVRVLHRRSSRLQLLSGLPIECVIGDITDRDSVMHAVEGADVIYHVAGAVSFWPRDRARLVKVNVQGTRHIVQAAVRHRVRRLVYTSSIATIGYRDDGRPADETTPYNWARYGIPYMETKWAAEREVLVGVEQGLDAVIVNPAVIFGPRDVNFHSGRMIQFIQQGKLPGYPPARMTVCDIDDVVEGHLRAMERGRTGHRYILGGETLSFREIFRTIAQVVGVPFPDREIPVSVYFLVALGHELVGWLGGRPPAMTRDMITAMRRQSCGYSSEKACAELGYRITPFRETIEKAYRWYKENGHLS